MPNTDPSGIEWVRVKDAAYDDGRHYSIAKDVAEADKDRYTVLKEHDALNVNGQPLPPKFNVEQAEKPADEKPTTAAKPAK